MLMQWNFTSDQVDALALLLGDWLDDSYTRGIDCGDDDVISEYRNTLETLRPLFEAVDRFDLSTLD